MAHVYSHVLTKTDDRGVTTTYKAVYREQVVLHTNLSSSHRYCISLWRWSRLLSSSFPSLSRPMQPQRPGLTIQEMSPIFSHQIHPFLWLDSPFSLARFTCEECVREMHGLAAMVKMGAIPIHVSRMWNHNHFWFLDEKENVWCLIWTASGLSEGQLLPNIGVDGRSAFLWRFPLQVLHWHAGKPPSLHSI